MINRPRWDPTHNIRSTVYFNRTGLMFWIQPDPNKIQTKSAFQTTSEDWIYRSVAGPRHQNKAVIYIILQHVHFNQVGTDVMFEARLNRIKDGSGSALHRARAWFKAETKHDPSSDWSSTRSAQTDRHRLQHRCGTELRFWTWPDLDLSPVHKPNKTKPRHRCVVVETLLYLYSETKPDVISHTSRTSRSTEPSRSSNMWPQSASWMLFFMPSVVFLLYLHINNTHGHTGTVDLCVCVCVCVCVCRPWSVWHTHIHTHRKWGNNTNKQNTQGGTNGHGKSHAPTHTHVHTHTQSHCLYLFSL